MQTSAVVVGIVGFIVVAGYAGLSWLRRGRDPSYADDSSILMAAPPPGMTAATATIVDGGPTRRAFMAALLDLASRDEIAFEEEGRDASQARVGIAIHGTETTDPQVLLNRRLSIGEGETWLLTQIKAAAMADSGGVPGPGHELPSPEAMKIGGQMLAALMHAGMSAGEDDDSPQARAAREHGLLSGPAPDIESFEAAYATRTGRPLPEKAREQLAGLQTSLQLLSDPAAIARDPDSFARQVEARWGKPLTAEQLAELRQWAASSVSVAAAAPRPEYIPAARARALEAPLFFGTFVQSYATRHGWLVGLPLLKRLRWRLIGAAEVGVAVLLAAAGSALAADTLVALGGGVAAGGAVTYLVAPAMASKTPAGAEMRAQLAAYRRTLEMTFSQARSMDEVVAAHRLTWLETPDQALVWGVALGLQHDIEALLARTADLLQQGHGSATTYVPTWYGSAPVATPTAGDVPPGGPARDGVSPGPPGPAGPAPHAAVGTARAMFEAIEAIGSQTDRAA